MFMVVFACRHCNFRYSPKSGRNEPPVVCPNCGKEETLGVQASAQELLKECDEMF